MIHYVPTVMPHKQLHKNPFYLKLWSFFGGLAFYTPVIVLYFLDNGVDLSMLVLAQAVYSIAIVAGEVPTGVIADSIGHKKSVIIGCAVEVLGFVSFLVLPNVAGLMLGYILLGLGDAFQSGSTEALLYEGTKQTGKTKEYRKHLSHVLSFRTFAFAIGTALAGIIYGKGGLDVLPYILLLSLLAKLTSGIVVFGAKDTKKSVKLKDSNMWQTFMKSVRFIRSDSTLKNITYVKVLSLTGQYVIFSTYQPYFEANGVSAYFIGFVLTIGALINTVLMRYIYLLERFLALDKVVLYFNLALAATYAVFSVVQQPWLLVLLFVLLQAQYNLQEPILSDYINDKAESETRATIISGISLIKSIANTISKVLLGLVLAGYTLQGMLQAQAIYLFAGAFLSYWLLVRCGCVYKIQHVES